MYELFLNRSIADHGKKRRKVADELLISDQAHTVLVFGRDINCLRRQQPSLLSPLWRTTNAPGHWTDWSDHDRQSLVTLQSTDRQTDMQRMSIRGLRLRVHRRPTGQDLVSSSTSEYYSLATALLCVTCRRSLHPIGT